MDKWEKIVTIVVLSVIACSLFLFALNGRYNLVTEREIGFKHTVVVFDKWIGQLKRILL